jgi:HK97 family phage portal protein
MKLFGYEFTISRTKTAVGATTVPSGWSSGFGLPFWGGGSSWFPIIQEPFTGAWQRNQEITATTLLAFPALYRCITLISQDISKMRIRLVEQDDDGIWSEVARVSPFWPVLTKPNRYQTRIQFFDEWMGSKLITGNTYVLKERDQRGIVVRLYVLHPHRAKPLVAPDGSVWYELLTDDLTGVEEDKVRVPASEIIHDRYKPLYHPLCGVPPVMACALSGMLGVNIAANSAKFFDNASRPGGIITAPDRINDEQLQRIKTQWEQGYTGVNAGRTAILSDGMKFEPIRENATDAQLTEQLKLTAEHICTAFGVPPYMIGVGDPPNYNNIEALTQQYYSQALQNLIESIELLLDEGLGLVDVPTAVYGTEFDLSDLLRMDTSTKSKVWGDLVQRGIASPDEARRQFDLPPVTGGDTPYLQHQNYSLEALAKRDAKDDPFATAKPPTDDTEADDDEAEEVPPPTGDNDNASSQRAALANRIIHFARYASARSPRP